MICKNNELTPSCLIFSERSSNPCGRINSWSHRYQRGATVSLRFSLPPVLDSRSHEEETPGQQNPVGPTRCHQRGLEDDLGPEVLLPGGVVAHSHLQHPLGLHHLHVLHVPLPQMDAAACKTESRDNRLTGGCGVTGSGGALAQISLQKDNTRGRHFYTGCRFKSIISFRKFRKKYEKTE